MSATSSEANRPSCGRTRKRVAITAASLTFSGSSVVGLISIFTSRGFGVNAMICTVAGVAAGMFFISMESRPL